MKAVKFTAIVTLKSLAIVAALSITTSNALAWGSGVHAYIADTLNKKAGWKNTNEIYGAMSPDIINFMFYSPHLQDMYAATHFNFEPIWQNSQTKAEHALALGFITHNNAWGADYTAHSGSLTLADKSKGYIIQKAAILAYALSLDSGFQSLGIPSEATFEICHTMVENSVELLMAQVDPTIGQKMVAAASQRDPAFPALFARTYAGDFAQYFNGSESAATQALLTAEEQFRQLMLAQGMALQQDMATALDELAEQNALMAQAYLAQYGVSLPDGFNAKALAAQLITYGIGLCQDDFAAEIAATLDSVQANLLSHGFRVPQY